MEETIAQEERIEKRYYVELYTTREMSLACTRSSWESMPQVVRYLDRVSDIGDIVKININLIDMRKVGINWEPASWTE